jgi:hypothetical protein
MKVLGLGLSNHMDPTRPVQSGVMTNNRTKVKNRDRKIDAYIHSDW